MSEVSPDEYTRQHVLLAAAKVVATIGVVAAGVEYMRSSQTDIDAHTYDKDQGRVPESYLSYRPVALGESEVAITEVAATTSVFAGRRAKIEQQIRDSGPYIVVPRFDADVQRLAYPGSRNEDIAARLRKAERSQDAAEYETHFWAGVGALAARHNKQVLVVDPGNAWAERMDTILTFGIPLAWAGSLAVQGIRVIADKPRLVRRHFLRGAGLAIAGYAIASKLGGMRAIRNAEVPADEVTPAADQWGMTAEDWRDMVVARRLLETEKLYRGKQGKKKKPIRAFVDRLRSRFADYLDDQGLVDTKLTLLQQYKIDRQPPKLYTYDSKTKAWKSEDVPVSY